MAQLRELQGKLSSIKALREIVNAMRNLAAVYVRRAEGALRAARPYAETVDTALNVALDRIGAPEARAEVALSGLVLVFASDQGLCGTYNERVVQAALGVGQEDGSDVQFAVIGRRGHDLLTRHGVTSTLCGDAPTSLEGIKSRVLELAEETFRIYTESRAPRLVFVYNTYAGMGTYHAEVRCLLPPVRQQLAAAEASPFQHDPIFSAPPGELLPYFIEEFFFISLYRALLESHASENGARLLAMTSASSNIDTRLADLTREYQAARQDAVTAELLDVVGGSEALI